MSELEFCRVFVSDNRSLKVKGFNETNKIGGFIGGKIKEVKGILDSNFKPNSIYKVLILFDLL